MESENTEHDMIPEDDNQPQFASIHSSLNADTETVEDVPPEDISLEEAYSLLAQRTFEINLIHEAGARLTRELDLSAICLSHAIRYLSTG